MRRVRKMEKWISFGLLVLALMIDTPLIGDNQTKYADYISVLEGLEKKDFKKIVIKEVNEYLHRFPDADNVDQMHFKIATIYADSKDEINSFFTHMEIVYLYPNSDVIPLSKDRVRSLLMQEKKFKPLAEKINTILHPATNDSTREMAYFAFLKNMHELDFEPITELLLNGYEQFLSNYPSSPHADAVLFWRGQLLAKDKEPEEALAAFMKLTYLYNSSLYVSASKLKIAELFTDKLKDHQKAILTLEEFLLEYPDDPQAAQAQFQIAKINEKKKKKYLEAINAYTGVAQRYPQSVEAVPALFQAARLYEEKFKEYDQAIRIYTEIVRDFPDDLKAPYAYTEAARIYERRLKDYFNAANVYFKVYGQYPESSIAAQSLFAAAEISEKRLKDYDRALRYYRFIVDQYSTNELAEKASKRIEKLSKKSIEN